MNNRLKKVEGNIRIKSGFRMMITFLMLLILVITSCRKLVDAPPLTNSISESNVYLIDAIAISVLNNLYILMNGNAFGQPIQGQRSISLLAGLSVDELTLYSGITSI